MSENKHISIKGVRGNRRSLLILSMQKDNVVMSRALAATHASFWDE